MYVFNNDIMYYIIFLFLGLDILVESFHFRNFSNKRPLTIYFKQVESYKLAVQKEAINILNLSNNS